MASDVAVPETTGHPSRWSPGQSGNPVGRPKGSRHKLSETFLRDLVHDWESHGIQALKLAREKDPVAYVKVVAGILPKDVAISMDTDLTSVLQAIDGRTRGIPDNTE